MTTAEVFLLLGYFTAFVLAGGLVANWFETKKKPGVGAPGQRNRK